MVLLFNQSLFAIEIKNDTQSNIQNLKNEHNIFGRHAFDSNKKSELHLCTNTTNSANNDYLINDMVSEFRGQLKDKITQLTSNFSWEKSTDGKSIVFLSTNRQGCNESDYSSGPEYKTISQIDISSSTENHQDQNTIRTSAQFYGCNKDRILLQESFVLTGKDIKPPTLDQFLFSNMPVTLQKNETSRYFSFEYKGQLIGSITSTKKNNRTTITFDILGARLHDITIYEQEYENKIIFETYPISVQFGSNKFDRTLGIETKLTVVTPKNSNFSKYYINDTRLLSKNDFNTIYQGLFIYPITTLHATFYGFVVDAFPQTTFDVGTSKDSEFFNELTRILTVRLTKPNPTDADIRDVKRFFEQTRDKIQTGKLKVIEVK